MAFQQLYYTSCEHGLGGYGGYQFNAVTPGVSPAVHARGRGAAPCTSRRAGCWPTRARTSRRPTRSRSPTRSARRPARRSPPTWCSPAPTTRAAPATTSPTPWSPAPRSGTSAPLLPVELWGADAVAQRPGRRPTTLPELPGPLPRGVIDPAGRAGIPRGAQGRRRCCRSCSPRSAGRWREPAGAAGQPGRRRERLVDRRRLLPARASACAPELTFTTYSHRPGYSRYHLIGTLPEVAAARRRRPGFQLFDLDAGQTRQAAPASAGRPARRTGVMAARGLWRQAAAFASGAEAQPGRLARPRRGGGRLCSAAGCPPARPAPWPGGCPARPAGSRPSSPTSSSACCWPGRPGALTDERLREPARRGPQATGGPPTASSSNASWRSG